MNTIHIMLEKITLTGLEPANFYDLLRLLIRFSMNLAVIMVLVRYLYYSVSRRKDYLFTYILISTIIFLLCFLLESVKLEIGFALGLFAVFGIIRYRTDSMPIKEMTYLFVVIGVSIINALANKKISMMELAFTNLIIIGIVYGYEKIWLLKNDSVKTIVYDKIDLIVPEKYNELIEDLKKRTGVNNIKRIEVGHIDFLKDSCRLNMYYEESGYSINLADQANSTNKNDDDDDD
jgi:hypothetical protein